MTGLKSPIPDRVKSSRIWWLFALTVLGVVCCAIAARIVDAIDYHNNDFFTFWLAGRLVVQGGDPYSPAQWVAGHHEYGVTWIPNQAFVYPLPLSLFFAPLGLLSLHQAYVAWVALSQGMFLAALLLLLSREPAPRIRSALSAPLLVGLVFFRPTILTLFNGQLTAWLLLLLAAAVWLWEKGHWGWGGALLALLALKPNLGGPLLILLAVWLLFQKRFKSILALLLGGLALLLIGVLQKPLWVADYWHIGNTKVAETFGGSPTVWGLGTLLCGRGSPCMAVFGGIAALLLVLGFLWLIYKWGVKARPLAVVSLAATITLLVTPYTWTYDQALLILPIAAVTFAWARRSFLQATLVFLGIDILTVVLLFFNAALGIEILNALIPLTVLGLCAGWLARPPAAAAGG